jgi:Mn2+/Fe2+ NRAMP family transporter
MGTAILIVATPGSSLLSTVEAPMSSSISMGVFLSRTGRRRARRSSLRLVER